MELVCFKVFRIVSICIITIQNRKCMIETIVYNRSPGSPLCGRRFYFSINYFNAFIKFYFPTEFNFLLSTVV